ncbi:MAG: cell division protein FtsA [Bacteroidaceae bacterium]|nr:cell division protein FtsA [Bacteroidaceae bacterium]
MGVKDFMVVIELGSTKISGLAGRKNVDGSLQILAYAYEDASSCIRKGVIYNIDKAASALTSIINKLEATLNTSIAKVYVGVSGQSLRTVRHSVTRHLDEDTPITTSLVEELIAADREDGLAADLTILDVIPQEYRVGGDMQADPVGMLGNYIEGRFLNVVARASVKHKIERSFAQAAIEIAGYFVTPGVMANVALTESERRSGCVLVDLGADTTTVQVHKDSILRHLVVLPLGGNNVTKDICSLQIEDREAEELKKTRASAFFFTDGSDSSDDMAITFGDRRSVSLQKLNEAVSARFEEIIVNVWHQVRLCGLDDKLLSGIILTGGSSNMRGLVEAFIHKTGIEKVRTLPTPPIVVHGSHRGFPAADACSGSLLGLLMAGEEDCGVPDTKVPRTAEEEQRAVTGQLNFSETGGSVEEVCEAEKREADVMLAGRQAEDDNKEQTATEPTIQNIAYTQEQNKENQEEEEAERKRREALERKAQEEKNAEAEKRKNKEKEKERKRDDFMHRLGEKITVWAKAAFSDEEEYRDEH